MAKKTKLIIGLIAITCLLLAQQPVSQGPQASNSAPWDYNLKNLNGGAVATGTGASNANTQRVVLSSDSPSGNPQPQTGSSFALSMYHSSSAAAANIKASGGNLYGLVLGNSGTIPCWLQLFNNAATPTPGTSVIDSYMVQAGTTVVIAPNVLALENFATGIAAAGATTDAGATTTGCTTTVSVTAYYK